MLFRRTGNLEFGIGATVQDVLFCLLGGLQFGIRVAVRAILSHRIGVYSLELDKQFRKCIGLGV